MRFGKLVGFVVFVVSLYLLWQIRQVVLLAFTGVVIATVINRLVRQFQKLHLRRGIAVTLSVTLVLTAIAGLFAIIVPSIAGEWQRLVRLIPQALTQLRESYTFLQNFIPGRLIEDIGSLEQLITQLPFFQNGWFRGFFVIFSNSIDFVLNLLLVIVVTIMLLANPEPYRKVFTLLFPGFYRPRVNGILDQCEESLVGWLIGVLFNMTVIAVMSGIGLWLLGVPLPLVNAILAGLLTFIPNLGPTLSVIPPATLALLEAPWKAGAVIILYIVIQQIESDILTPLVMRHEVSLLPAITLLSQVTFAIVFGLLGLFLALPLIVILQVWLRELLVKDILNQWPPPQKRR